MKVIIYIKILKNPEINFNDPELNIVYSLKAEDTAILDLDNFSSPELTGLASEMVNNSGTVCIIIRSESAEASFPFSSIMEPLFSSSKRLLIISEGNNSSVQKVTGPFSAQTISTGSLAEELERIRTFLSSPG